MNYLVSCLFLALPLITIITPLTDAQSMTAAELPKVEQPERIAWAFDRKGLGRISTAGKSGVVQQYLDVWEGQSAVPNVVVYVLLDGNGKAFTVVWGRGPVNTKPFLCQREKIPEFGEKQLWVAKLVDGKFIFEAIDDDDVKGLFSNILRMRQEWGHTPGPSRSRYYANITESNVLTFLQEKNRKKWLARSWLQPATTCVTIF